MLKEGVFLGKRYEILSRVGSGGMADVYKGKDHKLNRYVAIKVLKSDFRTDEIFIQKFLSEAQAAAGLMHPNVVNVYDVGQDRGLYFMVMELVEGITLKEYIEKKGRLTAKETISISIQMVTGIQAAHNQHIVHRDIKPQNIIISKEGKVKVTDFGIARATTSTSTISASVMGSVHYTSPEQARGGLVDEKSDLYSAGITMYEMVTGHVPFDGDSTVSVAIKHLQEEIISPAEEVPDIPYSLECIIMKCTQKNPERRYLSCEALILDLKRSLVSPEGDFVNMSLYGMNTDATVMMNTEEMGRIQDRGYNTDGYDDDDDYDSESNRYDDDDDYEYDSDEYDSRDDRYNRDRKRNNDVDPNTKKIMKILMIVAAVIIGFVILFMVGKAVGIFKSPGLVETEIKSQVSVPDLVGMTEEEAKAALAKKNLGYHVSDNKPSDKYEKGIIMSQETAAKTKVDKNTQINVVLSSGKQAKDVTIPDVTGLSEADAQSMLQDANLIVDSQPAYNDDVEKGKVISTDPVSGATVKEGSKVTMTVSLGAEKATVPNIVGMASGDADAALAAAGLATGTVTEDYSRDYALGSVMSQKTGADKKVNKGTAVDYVISKGPKIEMVTVPNLSNKTESAAIQALTSAGLVVGNVTSEYNSTVSKGYVISQSASPGSTLEKNATVHFVISDGSRPDEPANPDEGGDVTNGTE